MKRGNVFWGVLLIIFAVYILANNLGFVPDVNVVRIAIGLCCIIVFFRSLLDIEFGGMLFSMAILAICFDEQIGITAITPWPVLIAALLGSIGLNMIFGSSAHNIRKKRDRKRNTIYGDAVEGDEINIHGLFNGYKKNISSDDFKKAKVNCKFCGMEISFDDTVIQAGTAVIDLDVMFSGVEIYVPSSWKIVNNTDCVIGGFDEHHSSQADNSGPTLVFEGRVKFAGVDIYRI